MLLLSLLFLISARVKCRYFDCLVFFSEEEKNQAFFSLLFSHLSLLSKPLREGISGHLERDRERERENVLSFL